MEELSHRLSIGDLFRLSLRIFKTKPTRTILTILGMSVGIGTVVFLISLGYGLQYVLIGKLITTEDSLITLEAYYLPETNLNITREKLEEIKRIEGVERVSPVAEFPAEIKTNETTGIVLAKITEPNYFRLSGVVPDLGMSFEDGSRGMVASSQALKILNLNADGSALSEKLGVKVFYQSEQQAIDEEISIADSVAVKGIVVDDLQAPTIFIPQSILPSEPPFYRWALVKAGSIDDIEEIKNKLADQGFSISAKIDLVNQAKKVMNIITIVLGVFGIAALIVSAIGMFNTMIVGFLERIYEVGIMKSLGATDRDVKNLFLMESFLMGFLGGGCGILLGVGSGELFNLGLSVLSQHLGGKSLTLFVTPGWFIAVTLFLSSLIGIISGFWPARRASYLSPKEAFKNR